MHDLSSFQFAICSLKTGNRKQIHIADYLFSNFQLSRFHHVFIFIIIIIIIIIAIARFYLFILRGAIVLFFILLFLFARCFCSLGNCTIVTSLLSLHGFYCLMFSGIPNFQLSRLRHHNKINNHCHHVLFFSLVHNTRLLAM